MPYRLFHFSDDDAIEIFHPRPVRTPAQRPADREWLNGPLVWAIDEWHQPMYLFPRECPRILIWRKPESTPEHVARFFGDSTARMIAHIEASWHERVATGHLYRYELPAAPFESLEDAGMWVARSPVRPLGRQRVDDLPGALRSQGVELRVLPSLAPLAGLWDTSLHASGIRLRNATDWPS